MSEVVPSQILSYIEREYPALDEERATGKQVLTVNHASCGSLAGLVELVERLPSHLQPSDPERFSELTLGAAAIRSAVTRYEHADAGTLGAAGGNFTLTVILSRDGWSPVSLIRRAMTGCPDSVPAPGTSDFPFISNEALRDALRLDLNEINEGIRTRSYKSATVLAGALVEALLLWAIEQKTAANLAAAIANLKITKKVARNLDPDPKRWHLSEYTEVALELGLIVEETAQQCRLAKDFRNLIHPGRAQRTDQACDRGTALSAAAAVEHVAANLS